MGFIKRNKTKIIFIIVGYVACKLVAKFGLASRVPVIGNYL